LSDSIDQELAAGLLAPPENFAARVMVEIAALPLPEPPRPRARARVVIEWLALAGAVLAGLAQLIPFLFGAWTITSAG
jgi:hypothetical protein